MKKCSNCGTLRRDDGNFCSYCGSPYYVVVDGEVPTQAEPVFMPTPTPSKKKPGRVASFFTALLYPLLYLAISFAIGLAYSFILGFMAGISGDLSIIENPLSGGVLEVISLLTNVLFIVTAIVISLIKRRNPLKDYGINKFSPTLIAPAALLGAAANVVLSFIIGIIPWPESWILNFESNYGEVGSSGLVISLISVCLVTGIAEELLFRGGVMSRFKGALGKVFAVIGSAVVFGLFHGTPIAIFYSTLFGLVLGAMSMKAGSIAPAIIAHIFFNTTALFLAYVNSSALMLGILLLSVAVCLFTLWAIFKKAPEEAEEECGVTED